MRTLYPGPRPAVAFSVMLALLAGIFFVAAPAGARLKSLTDIWKLAVVFLVVLGLIYSVQIRVEEDGIAVIRGFWSRRAVRFGQISHSVPRIMGERNHPLWLDIYGEGASLLLRVPLKALRQRDVDWLMSLNQLMIRARSGGPSTSLERTREK
jgi:hypothetical protein